MLADISFENQALSPSCFYCEATAIEQVIATKTSFQAKFYFCSCEEERRFQDLIQLEDLEFSKLFKPKPQVIKSPRVWPGHSYDGRAERNVLYGLQMYEIAYDGKIKVSMKQLAKELGVHINTLEKSLKNLRKWGLISWQSGKPAWKPNYYFIHAKGNEALATMGRPTGYKLKGKLWFALQGKIKKQGYLRRQEIFRKIRCFRDNVDDLLRRWIFLRTQEEKKASKGSKDPPKTRAGPKKTIYWQLLAQFNFTFKEKAILSSYGEAPLRAAINDLESYSGKISNPIAFLISRCKAIKTKLDDLAKELTATPEENLRWLKEHLSKDSIIKKCKFFTKPEEINRATKTRKPYLRLMIHKSEAKRSKLIIEQKVNGHWVDKVIELSRGKFRTAVMTTLEMAFGYAGCV